MFCDEVAEARTKYGLGFRWVMSSAAARLRTGIFAWAVYSEIASSSNAASGPKIMSTWSRSTSSCVLVLVPAGLPPVSATTSSTLRPASMWFRSLRNRIVPCSIWIPPVARGPVFTVRRPMRTGLFWAMAGAGSVAARIAPVVPARNSRRPILVAIAVSFASRSVALGQPEHVFRDVVEDHLLRHRRDLVEAHLAPEPLDVELLGIAVAAVGLEGDVARLEAGLGCEELGGVRLGAAGPSVVEEPRRLHTHEPRRLELRPRERERMSDRLVLADRPVEDDALLGVLHGAIERGPPDADRLDPSEDALGVHRVEEMVEAPAHLADHVRLGDLEAVDEDLVGVDGRAPELLDLADRDPAAVELREKARQARERLGRVAGCRASQQQDMGRVLSVGVPHLPAVDDVTVAVALRARLDPRGVGAGVGLGHAERHDDLAGSHARQVAPLHVFRTVLDHGH